MSFWTRVRQWLREPAVGSDGEWSDDIVPQFNLATGLPLINGFDGLGNPSGIDFHRPFDGSCGHQTPSHDYTPASASQVYTSISSCDPNRGW